MGVDSKIVCIGSGDEKDIIGSIINNLLILINHYNKLNKKSSEIINIRLSNPDDKWSYPEIDFSLNKERRRISIFLNCDEDEYKSFGRNKKIICSVGAWGKNEEIIFSVANALTKFGKTYYIMDDCSDDTNFKDISKCPNPFWKKILLKDKMNKIFID